MGDTRDRSGYLPQLGRYAESVGVSIQIRMIFRMFLYTEPLAFMKRQASKPGDVYPSHVLLDEYAMNAANRPTIVVNSDEVPEGLRLLIPYVERWAIPCDVTRLDYFDQQPEVDIAAFWEELLPHEEAIGAWLDSLGQDISVWPDAAVHFVYLLKAHNDAYQPSEDEKKAFQAKEKAWAHEQSRRQAVEDGMSAFARKDYAAMVDLLKPFESELEKVTKAKLDFARKKLVGSRS
jgi:hypothetical protein